MKQTTDPKFNRFLKKNRIEAEPSEQTVNRIREIAAKRVSEKENTIISFKWRYSVAMVAIVLIAFVVFSSEQNTNELIVFNQELTEDLELVDNVLNDMNESIDTEFELLSDNNLGDEILDLGDDINEILDEF